MKYSGVVNAAIQNARKFILEGGEQILSGQLDTAHSISPSPGAAALATLALIGLGGQFENQVQLGAQWLRENRQSKGWGRFPGGDPDTEVTRLIETILIGSQPGVINKLFLLSQAEDLSKMVLCLGEQAVPGLEGPEPDEIHLPKVLNEKVLQKLPSYGRPVVVAASLLAAKDMSQNGVRGAVEYLRKTQMADGSWSEDIVTTSLAIIAFIRAQKEGERTIRAGHWLASKQYENGAWAPVSRTNILTTQTAVLLSSNATLVAATILGLFVGTFWFKIRIKYSRYLSLGTLSLAFFSLISSYSFLFAAWAEDGDQASAYAYGLTFVFYALDVIGGLSKNSAWVGHFSIFKLFKPQEVLEGTLNPSKAIIGLTAGSAILTAITVGVFNSRDLPL